MYLVILEENNSPKYEFLIDAKSKQEAIKDIRLLAYKLKLLKRGCTFKVTKKRMKKPPSIKEVSRDLKKLKELGEYLVEFEKELDEYIKLTEKFPFLCEFPHVFGIKKAL